MVYLNQPEKHKFVLLRKVIYNGYVGRNEIFDQVFKINPNHQGLFL